MQLKDDFDIALRREGLFEMMSIRIKKFLRNLPPVFMNDFRMRVSGPLVRGQEERRHGSQIFDMLIVLSEVDQKIDRWIRDIAWEVGFENDRVITTILLDKVQFEHGPMSESTIVDNVLREGISA